MAPYLHDALEYAPYHSNMATLQMRNKVLKYWPRVTVTDSVTGLPVEVFDRLYVLWDDIYVTLDKMNEIGKTTTKVKVLVDGQSHNVGDVVTIQEYNIYIYPNSIPPAEVNSTYPITEVIEPRDEVSYFNYNNIAMGRRTVSDCTIVMVEVPVTPFKFNKLTDAQLRHMLLDSSGIKSRKYLYQKFGISDVLEERSWNKLDRAWLQFSDYREMRISTSIPEMYAGYLRGCSVGKQFTVVTNTSTNVLFNEDVANASDMDAIEARLGNQFDTCSNITYVDVYTNTNYSMDEKFVLYTLLKARELKNSSTVLSVDSEYYSPVLASSSEYCELFSWDEGCRVTTVSMTNIMTFTINDLFDASNQIFIDIQKDAEKLASYTGEYVQPTIGEQQWTALAYNKFLILYLSTLPSAELSDPNSWVVPDDGGIHMEGLTQYTRRLLTVDGFKNSNIKKFKELYDTMNFDYVKDSSKSSGLVSVLVVIGSFALILAALMSGQWYIIAIVIPATFISTQIALANAGYTSAAFTTGMFYKFYGYITIATGSVATVIRNVATVAVLKEVTKRITTQIGGSLAIALNTIVTVGTTAFGGDSVTSKSVATGIMAGVRASMATDTQLSMMQMSEYSLAQDEQEILDEIDEKDREAAMASNTAGFISQDQKLWNEYHLLNPVDRTEDWYKEMEFYIDSKTTAYYN